MDHFNALVVVRRGRETKPKMGENQMIKFKALKIRLCHLSV